MKSQTILKKIIFLIIILSLHSVSLQAQSKNGDFWRHVRFGGGIGLGFGDGFFNGTLSPSAIYQFDQTFALGLGMNFSYFKRKNFHKSTIVGGSVIALANPIDFLQLSAEFEQLNVNRDYDENFVGNQDTNYWYPALFLGAGFRNGNFAFGIRYDVLYDQDKSIYGDAWMPFARFYF